MKKIIILGSTGSIGTQALDIVRANPDKYSVVAIAAGSNADLIENQAREFGVKAVALFNENKCAVWRRRCLRVGIS